MRRLLVAWCLSLCTSLTHAQLPSPVSEALGKAGVPQEAVAVLVQSVNKQDGAPIRLVDHRADQAMNLA